MAKITRNGHFSVERDANGFSLNAIHVASGKHVAGLGHLTFRTMKSAVEALNLVEERAAEALETIRTDFHNIPALTELRRTMRAVMPVGSWS